MLSKMIPLGDKGSLEIAESAGVVSLKVSIGASLGGGEAAGVLSGKLSAEVDLSAQQVADLGIGLLKVKFPSLASVLDLAQKALDAELAKV